MVKKALGQETDQAAWRPWLHEAAPPELKSTEREAWIKECGIGTGNAYLRKSPLI